MVFASNRVIRLPSGKVFFNHETFRAVRLFRRTCWCMVAADILP